GVKAELSKLNVYSATSGQLQKTTNKTKSTSQFGTLIVCLPYSHEGGQLFVYHKRYNSAFDWSQQDEDSNTIQWTAFYSDCEYEIGPVKSGHCITLTYNLYLSERVGGLLQRNPSIDPTLFPLHGKLTELLEQPGFLYEGGTIGYACTHLYSHTTRYTELHMPYSLRGLDTTIFTVFSSLARTFDIRATVRPLLSTEPWDEHLQYREENNEDDEYWDPQAEREEHAMTDRVGEKFERVKILDKVLTGEVDPSSVSLTLPFAFGFMVCVC
ncbi:uncharacterized protein LY89DRAFT_592152, partial [Mollisia scopiformis]